MGQLVHQQQARAAKQGSVEVELLQGLPAIGNLDARQDGEVADLRLGFRPAVRLDDAGQYVAALGGAAAGLEQHLPGLADAGRGAEEHLEPPAPFTGGGGDQGVWIGAGVVHWPILCLTG